MSLPDHVEEALSRLEGAQRRLEQSHGESADDAAAVPDSFCSVKAAPRGPADEERVLLRGAVLVRVRGRRRSLPVAAASAAEQVAKADRSTLSPELLAALDEKPGQC